MRLPQATPAARRLRQRLAALALIGLILSACSVTLNPDSLPATIVKLPGSTGAIGFDDMSYDATLGKVIVPAGNTGNLDLIDPDTMAIKAIPGFSTATPDVAAGHSVGTTSAISHNGVLFAIDQITTKLDVIDPVAGAIIKSTALITSPDYIRYVPPTNELWVTEKGASQIEVFSLSNDPVPQPSSTSVISFTKGPEALVIDSKRGMAYTNFAKNGQTVPIDIKTHTPQDPWPNGCTATRGMVLDEARGILFVACKEGKISVLNVADGGRLLANTTFGSNLDFLGYNPHLSHLYIPSGSSAVMAVIGVTAEQAPPPATTGQLSMTLTLLGTADTGLGSKCMIADDRDSVWVCDPTTGQLFHIKDTFPAN
jgi:DNA-binding beta-propeller fold protein YncE